MDANDNTEQLQTPLLSSQNDSGNMGDNTEQAPVTLDSSPALPHLTPESDAHVWYRNPHQVTAMISNYSTSYNVVNISLVLPILRELHSHTSSEDEALSASSLLAGMILGQLVGGALGDSFLGRLGALRLVMALQVVASVASSLLSTTTGDIFVKLAMWRFVLGVGAGGVYPLAAVLSAEQGKNSRSQNNDSDVDDQVHRVVLTFSTQGLGFITVPVVATVLLHSTNHLGLIWRLLLAFGSLPGIFLMILQWRLYANESSATVPLEEPEAAEVLEEQPVETKSQVPPATLAEPDGDNAVSDEVDGVMRESSDRPARRQRGWMEAIRQERGLGRKLLGTAGTWFLFDVVFYGNSLFQPIVIEAAFGAAKSESSIHILQKAAMDSLVLTAIALPGYAVVSALIGKKTLCLTQTPRYIMLQGFGMMGVLYFAIGMNWSFLRHYPAALLFLYGMTFFFANYGPNTTTFILPSLLYSPECRSTWNGISAAAGKLGALTGATLFAPVAEKWGDDIAMIVCATLAIAAFLLTHAFVPSHPQEVSMALPDSDEIPEEDETE